MLNLLRAWTLPQRMDAMVRAFRDQVGEEPQEIGLGESEMASLEQLSVPWLRRESDGWTYRGIPVRQLLGPDRQPVPAGVAVARVEVAVYARVPGGDRGA